MSNIKQIAEHSVDVDLLTGGICIDVGCRGFQFSEAMRDLGCEVVAIDIENLDAPRGIFFLKYALSDRDGALLHYKDTNDQQAKHISDTGIPICSHDLNWFYEHTAKRKIVDVLKLDIEGSEYLVLSDPKFLPIPRQISVEFHEHCHKDLHDKYFNTCMENLLKYYEPVQHERYAAHGAGMNWWNSLFVRRDLL